MATSQIVIFYATGSKQVRGVLVPDSDQELATFLKAGLRAPAGETMLLVPAFASPQKAVFDPANHQYVIDCVTRETGVVPPDPACAVVNDKGVVESIINADEAIDTLPGKVLVQKYDPVIAPGCIYDAGSKQFAVPAQDVPAAVDRQGQMKAATTIPAKVLVRGAVLQN